MYVIHKDEDSLVTTACNKVLTVMISDDPDNDERMIYRWDSEEE